jgi:hypothetical protein
MRKYILLIILLLPFCQQVHAACSGKLSSDENLVIKEDFMLDPHQSNSVHVGYNDTTCTGTNTITKLSTNSIVIGMFDNTVKLKLEVAWANNSNISLSSGATAINADYTVTVTEAGAGDVVNLSAGSGGVVDVNSIAMMSSGGNGGAGAVFSFIICLFSDTWNNCVTNYRNRLSGGVYSANLHVVYNRKLTTCIPNNPTITLGPVAIGELRQRGEVNEPSATGNIVLACENMVSGNIGTPKSSRKISVYLKSDYLLDDSNYVLIPEDHDNGVGFILKDSSGGNVFIHRGTATDNMLMVINKGAYLSASESIPITAKYYVFDPDKVKNGRVSSKARIMVSYD